MWAMIFTTIITTADGTTIFILAWGGDLPTIPGMIPGIMVAGTVPGITIAGTTPGITVMAVGTVWETPGITVAGIRPGITEVGMIPGTMDMDMVDTGAVAIKMVSMTDITAA